MNLVDAKSHTFLIAYVFIVCILQDGRIKNIGKIHNHTLDSEKSFCECHEDCPCNGVCALSLTTRHLLEEEDGGIKRPSMEIVRTPFLGWSLRAAQFIPRGGSDRE